VAEFEERTQADDGRFVDSKNGSPHRWLHTIVVRVSAEGSMDSQKHCQTALSRGETAVRLSHTSMSTGSNIEKKMQHRKDDSRQSRFEVRHVEEAVQI